MLCCHLFAHAGGPCGAAISVRARHAPYLGRLLRGFFPWDNQSTRRSGRRATPTATGSARTHTAGRGASRSTTKLGAGPGTMGRSRVAAGATAAAIGAVLGFLALFLREMGLALAEVVLLGLTLFYAHAGRISDLGWLLVAAGAVTSQGCWKS